MQESVSAVNALYDRIERNIQTDLKFVIINLVPSKTEFVVDITGKYICTRIAGCAEAGSS